MIPIPPKLYAVAGAVAIGGFLIWKFKDELSGIVKGGLLAGSGLGLAYVGQNYFKDNKPVQTSLTYGGLAVTGLGAYFIAKPYIDKLRGYVPASTSDRVGINITSPSGGTNWCYYGSEAIKAKVTNLEAKSIQVLVGLTIVDDATGQMKDYALKNITLEPMGTGEVRWDVSAKDLPEGDREVHVAVWNKAPQRGVVDPSVVKLGDDFVKISVKGYVLCQIT